MPDFEQILGVRFINASATEAVEYISQKGGYTVVPAAPALANIQVKNIVTHFCKRIWR